VIRAFVFVSLLAGTASAHAQTIDAARLADPIAELGQTISHRYAYRDVAHVDWAARVDEFKLRLRATNTPLGFAQVAAAMLAVAADPHIFLEVGDERVYPTKPLLPATFDRTLLPALVPDVKSDERCISSGRATDGTAYLVIAAWTDGCAVAANSALDALFDAPALIVDVRSSHGGDPAPAASFAGRFVDRDTRFGSVEWVTERGFGERRPRVLHPNARATRYAGRVAVLMGPSSMGAAEAFLLMMRAAGAKLVGDVSYGSIGDAQPTRLSNGITLWLPAGRERTLDGHLVEGVGVTPDLRVTWPRAPAEDVVLRRALALLDAR
jgi:hypothetical protein